MDLRESRVAANGIEFAYLEAGPPGNDHPLVLCLHGFPDSAWTWRHLLPDLAAAGYHAVAPFNRGYAPTDVPPDGRYQSGALVADACALHEALGGGGDAVLIGHDWGAMAAYGAASFAPDRWRRVVTAAVPPAAVLMQGLLTYEQTKRSFYIWLFQLPIAELAVSADDLAFIDGLWRDWSPGYDGAEDVAHVKDCLREPDRLGAAIGYYRAMFDPSDGAPELAEQQAAAGQTNPQPTLYLHGTTDGCLGIELIHDVESHLAPGSRYLPIEGAGHFLHVEKPAEVNARILEFLAG